MQKDLLKYFEYSTTEKPTETSAKELTPHPPSKYHLPSVLETLKKKTEPPEVPKWKTTVAVISKVR